jgi:hydroxymethylglutaryl-CoA synthase
MAMDKRMTIDTRKVGISDIQLHIPQPKLDLEVLVKNRARAEPRLGRHLERAIKVTGQRAIRFPQVWEDTATMAAQAVHRLLERSSPVVLPNLRHLVVGTETTVDQSKPVSAYVQGMLQRSGLEVPQRLSSFQVQHACAGATMSLVSAGSMMALGNRAAESGLVIASDIARYQTATTAEVTQGAGAVALLLETSPRLLELELVNLGYCSRDVDDFFRPVGSHLAQVRGRYSMDCYLASLNEAFLDHCQRVGELPADVLESTNFFVLHTPFRNMPEIAMQDLLKRHLHMDSDASRPYLEEKGFYHGVDPLSDVGNLYSGSMYMFLVSLLHDRYRVMGEAIVGKRLMLASYGSGNTMIVYTARVAEGAPEVIKAWDFDSLFTSARESTMEEYEVWAGGPYERAELEELLEGSSIPAETYYLSGIREDGYREYKYAAAVRDWIPEREASVDLRRSVPVLR